jgi:hypothetical protein
LTTTVPVIIDPCTTQKYGNVPAEENVCEKLPVDRVPESQRPSGVQQLPDVVECRLLTKFQVTVPPAWIVVVGVPLTESTNRSFWTATDAALEVGVGVAAGGVGVAAGGVGVAAAGVAVAPGCVGVVIGGCVVAGSSLHDTTASSRGRARNARRKGDLMGHLLGQKVNSAMDAAPDDGRRHPGP